MLRINTLSGSHYTTIYLSENDVKYIDLFEYIKKPVHPIYKNISDVDYDEGTCDIFEILIDTRIHLSHNGVEVKMYDNINFDIDNLIVHFTQKYIYFNGEFDDDMHETAELDNALEMIDNQTEKICEEFIHRDPLNIIFVKNKTMNLCKLAVRLQGRTLRYIPPEMKTYELCNIAVLCVCEAIEFVPDECKNYDMCKDCIRLNGFLIKYVPPDMITSEMCKYAVDTNPYAFVDIPDKMKTNKICKIAVHASSTMLKYVPDKMKTYEICKIAIENAGYASEKVLKYIPDKYKNNLKK